jgi:hypothetical protein
MCENLMENEKNEENPINFLHYDLNQVKQNLCAYLKKILNQF